MTKDEALKLALDALEQWNTPLYKRAAAITAIREALEEPSDKPAECTNGCPPYQVCDWCQRKPADEPVAWQLSPTDIYDFAGWLTTRKGVMTVGSSCEAGPMAEAVGEYLKTFPERFNTRPQPAAQWVGLTDDAVYAAAEIAWRAGWAACRDAEFVGEEAEDEAWGYQGATVAKDIEAKLREKNGGGV